jgi:uncharacterized protein (TIGR00290 family)
VKSFLSSSGGKDSLLALSRARARGYDVVTLVTMFDETGLRSRSHGIGPELALAQAAAMGCDLIMPCASWANYEVQFVSALTSLAATGHTHAVFGDIDLQAHRDWEEKVCAQSGLIAVLPLWGENRVDLAREAIDSGIEAVVVCVDSRFLSDDFVGRRYDAAFLADLPDGVDACGENGEFHTFAVNSPLFISPLQVELRGTFAFVAPQEFGGTRYCFADLALSPVVTL